MGCHVLVRGPGYCPDCRRQEGKAIDERRGSAAERGYGWRWQKARAAWLRVHPLCASCEKEGRTTAARVVDHVVPHRGDRKLFWDKENWQSLCTPCHDRKTAEETFRGGARPAEAAPVGSPDNREGNDP